MDLEGEATGFPPRHTIGENLAAPPEAAAIAATSLVTSSPRAATARPTPSSAQDKCQSFVGPLTWLSKMGTRVDYLLGDILASDLEAMKTLSSATFNHEMLFYTTKVIFFISSIFC